MASTEDIPGAAAMGANGVGDEAATVTSELRLRRVKSTSRAQEIVTEDEKQRRAQPDKPIHRPRDSLFSWSSNFQNYEGVMNWAFLLLFLGGTRLFLENLNKYGIRVDPSFWLHAIFGNVVDDTGEFPTLYLILYTNIIFILCLFFEKLLAKEWISWTLGCTLHAVNLLSLLVVPPVVINMKYEYIGPVRYFFFVLLNSVAFFKLWSYVHVNRHLRKEYLSQRNPLPTPPPTPPVTRTSLPKFELPTLQELKANATIVCSMYSIAFLKLVSYIQVNYWCRNHSRHAERSFQRRVRSPSMMDMSATSNKPKGILRREKQNIVMYPDNLTVKDLYYFWLAPTLCYELNFPKMERIRKLFLIRRVLEVIVGSNIALGLIQQWIIPSVVNSLIPFSRLEFGKATERLLKIAIPNHLIWLTWFYLLFHSFLNTIGEILQFADREFYLDWWNANNILTFWKTWNLPVHRWCVRHVFKPVLRNGYSVFTAQIIVFFISAFFHEYLISVPLRVFKVYAFMGMFLQIPLIFISRWVELNIGERAGNICVWLSLIIGQPLAVMMYYHDFVVEHYGKELIEIYGKIN